MMAASQTQLVYGDSVLSVDGYACLQPQKTTARAPFSPAGAQAEGRAGDRKGFRTSRENRGEGELSRVKTHERAHNHARSAHKQTWVSLRYMECALRRRGGANASRQKKKTPGRKLDETRRLPFSTPPRKMRLFSAVPELEAGARRREGELRAAKGQGQGSGRQEGFNRPRRQRRRRRRRRWRQRCSRPTRSSRVIS